MIQKQNFIDKIVNKISEEIDIKLSEELENYDGSPMMNIFIDLNPKFLDNEEIYNAIIAEMNNRNFFVKEITSSSDRIPKTLISLSLID